MLQYRLFVEVDDDPRDVEKKATEQLYSWLRDKNLNADALTPGSEVTLGAHASGSLSTSNRQDGSRSLRAVIIEDNQRGKWTTTLTVDVPGSDRRQPWLWLDLDGPETTRGNVPRLARTLLEVFEGKAEGVRHGEAQPVTETESVAALIDAVCAPDRRGLIFIAGSDSRLPFNQWVDLVRSLLQDCVGLSSGYILDPHATEMFNNAIGPEHRVAPWTLRTFRPGVEPDDPADGRRHKVLGQSRITSDPTRQLARMLGWRAREAALSSPLPAAARRVDRIFDQIVDQRLVGTLAEPAIPAHPQTELPVADPILKAVSQVLGGGAVTRERILELGELVELGRSARESRAAIGNRLASYEDALAFERSERQELQALLVDTQLEYAVADEERVAAEAEVRRLQKLLVVSDQASQVWLPSEELTADPRPSDCVELASQIDSWPSVRFTGNTGPLQELDQYDETGTWAGKIWEIFSVLDDYARVVRSDEFAGDVHYYLSHTPLGYRTFPPQKHAQDEREQVRTNPKFHSARVFPVPLTVDEAGEVFMGAHFKIAKYKMISPRLHYYNDIRNSGMIYVGYVGRHLPSPQTN